MSTASRESSAAAVERLEALVADREPAALAATADDLFAIAALLRREPRLRRALADPARDGQQRVDLLRGLLGGSAGPRSERSEPRGGERKAGKAGEDAIDLASTLVAGRWSRPSELLDATERLGVEALLASVAGTRGRGGAVAGTRVRGGAVERTAQESTGDLGDVEDELFRFGQIVDGDPRLAAALGDTTAEPARRATLARGLLEGRAMPATVRLVELALSGFGGRGFAASLTRLIELVAERRDRQVAYVTVAMPLTDDEERRLGDKLSQLYGREVSLKVTVDPEIIGGISVQIGHDRYDGTILRRLTQTRNALAR